MIKHILIFLLAAVLCLSFSGCSLASEQITTEVSDEDDDIVHLALSTSPESYDIQKGGSAEIAAYNFSRLVKITDNGDGSAAIAPDLAESWEISSDGLSYTFHLREGVFFQNEKEFESDDILYTADRMLQQGTEQIPESFRKIRGAADLMDGAADSMENLGVFISDKYTVVIMLETPCVSFLEDLTDVCWSIYNRDAASGEDLCTGTGPFIPEKLPDGGWFLKKNEKYFGNMPQISGIRFLIVESFSQQLSLFQEGRVDILSFAADRETIQSYMNDPVCKDYLTAEKKCRIYFYCMNQSLAPFSDLNIRQGLQIAIDRSSILNKIFLGQGQLLHGFVPEGMLFSDRTSKRLKYSKEDAIELFTKAGYTEGFGVSICQTSHSDEEARINEMVCQQLKTCGINATIKEMDDAAFLSAKSSGSLPMYLAYAKLDTRDPDLLIHSCFGETGNARWSLNYTDEYLKKLVEESSRTFDMNLRGQKYRDIEALLIQEDAVVIPLFQIFEYTLVNPRIVNYSTITGNLGDISIR